VPPDFRPEQEVRFAVVMYGGVSLAIYINGVAQELFRLVRATAPAHMYSQSNDLSLKDKVFYPDEQLDETERVYRRLGQMLGLDATAPGGDTVRTRFVVDIISGTSAGGINGVLLGLALTQQKDFRGRRSSGAKSPTSTPCCARRSRSTACLRPRPRTPSRC
jgi:hypothetical protein